LYFIIKRKELTMDISIFLAQAFGLYLTISAIAMFVKRKRINAVIDGITTNPALLFVIAFITLILGILLILSHNIWVADWRVVITLLAWVTFIAGIVRLFFPEMIVKMANNVKSCSVYYTITTISLLVGVYLLWIGFCAK
jgi:hypothetical protein